MIYGNLEYVICIREISSCRDARDNKPVLVVAVSSYSTDHLFISQHITIRTYGVRLE